MGEANYRSYFVFVSFRFILFTTTLMFLLERAVSTDTLTRFQELSVGETLLSSGKVIELGFFTPTSCWDRCMVSNTTTNSTNRRYIGIWYKNIALTKPVWVMNRENPLDVSDSGSVLTVASDGNLKLLDGKKKTVWSTNISSNPNDTVAVISDKGELSLKDTMSDTVLWKSFEHPSDSLIAGMRIGHSNRTGERYELNSWRTKDDPSPGEFVLGFTIESPPQNIMWKNGKPHWRSGPWDGMRFIGLYQTNTGYSNGFTVVPDNQAGSVFASYNSPSSSQVMVEIVTPDGNLEITRWDIGTQEGGVKWRAIEVFCDVYNSCGPFGVCNRPKATCECLKGFVPNAEHEWKQGNWTKGCKRRVELECAKNTSTLSNTGSDGFKKLKNMKVPDHHTYLFGVNASDCKTRCLSNCLCLAYTYVDGITCLIWTGELLDLQKFKVSGVDVYLRLAHSELDDDKQRNKLVAILVSIFGVLVLGAFMYSVYRCIQNRKALKRHRIQQMDLSDKMAPLNGTPLRDMWNPHASQTDSSDLLPMFDFATLSAATNIFNDSNKLGAGGFGPVYMGTLEDGQEIAVKRLSSHSGQGAVEFKNEILLISKLQHRNLVRLLGYCIKGDEKLLVYEYLKNKSLDTFLFDKRMGLQLDWAKRFNIIEGIARGLLYLHRDSCLRVIHRDLKPSNILLDDNMNPKISDFGLARAFQITQELANTHRVVGTFGYMSPEYAMGGLLSEKSDVFSFGVMILEIISGERNTSFLYEEKYLNLLGYAWWLWNENKCIDFMNKELPDSCPSEEFKKFMQIGLLCVQDHSVDRPTMSAVVLMLTGDTNVPQPKEPTFYQGLMYSDLRSQFKKLSLNAISVTNAVGR